MELLPNLDQFLGEFLFTSVADQRRILCSCLSGQIFEFQSTIDSGFNNSNAGIFTTKGKLISIEYPTD